MQSPSVSVERRRCLGNYCAITDCKILPNYLQICNLQLKLLKNNGVKEDLYLSAGLIRKLVPNNQLQKRGGGGDN